MDWRHFKNALSTGLFKISYLNHYRQYFNQVNQPYNRYKKRHLQHISRRCDKAPKRKRTCIPHKHTRRIYIEQQKSKQRAHDCTSNRFNPAFCSNCHNCKKRCHQNRHTGCKTIQSVCEIHSIDRSNHYNKQKRKRKNSPIQIFSFRKRNQPCERHICKPNNIISKYSRHQNLQCHFLLWIQSVRPSHHNFQIII